jgi:oligoribonuclease NrnB/cAMP/cGMP phosphodiesterase (DHH superfamily)
MTDTYKPDLVIYHGGGCADGFGAAWACRARWGDGCTYLAANYGTPPPDVTGKHVLIVDFSYKRDVLEVMAFEAASIIILDHHETAEEELSGFAFHGALDPVSIDNALPYLGIVAGQLRLPVIAVFDMKRSGAHLAWSFCHPGKDAPLLIKLIEDRDLWLFHYDATRPFATWLRSEPFDFARWDRIADDIEVPYGNDIMREAIAMQRFHDAKVQEIASFATRAQLGEHEPIVVNCPPMFSSEVGNYLLDAHPDAPFAATYFDTRNKRMFSLRSKDDRLAVSTIAAGYGGGGHRNAAGFSVAREVVLP